LASTLLGDTIPRCFRISKGSDVGDILDSVEALPAFARDHGPGRYDVDEHSLDRFPGSNHVDRAWGHLIYRQDGRIDMEPHPWLAS
jgi:hypothetical protein